MIFEELIYYKNRTENIYILIIQKIVQDVPVSIIKRRGSDST